MPNRSAPPAGSRYTGLWRDMVNNNIELYHNGTLINSFSASTPNAVTGALSATTTITAGTNLVATAGSVSAGTTVTATLGAITATNGNFVSTVGNAMLGTPSVFATTQPQGAVCMGGTTKTGIAPVGTTATSAAIFASDTVVRKILADGTASNVET